MGKPNVGDIIQAVQDPMLSDNFQLNFPRIPSGESTTPLLMQCRTATKPGMTINAVEVQVFGHTLEYVGNLTYSHDMSVEYVENSKGVIHAILERWADFCRSHRTQHGAKKADYAVDAYLTIFDVDGSIVREYTIKNCWPKTVPDTSFDGSGANLISVATSFAYDYYELKGGAAF